VIGYLLTQRSITFGSQHKGYDRFPLADPDGWLVIESNDEHLLDLVEQALFLDDGLLRYAFRYNGPEPSSPELYRKGRLATITVVVE